jgi:hypothetical protein
MTNTDSLYHQAEAFLARLNTAKDREEPFDINHFVHRLLAKYHRIAAIWGIEDVQGVRPDLTDEQAFEVLEQVGDKHDAEWCITWTTLETVADGMFPNPYESNEPASESGGRP